MNVPLSIESPIEVETEHAVPGGRCLARIEGKVVLVTGALPGETVRARITRDSKRWAEAEAVEIVRAHPGRRSPPCPHAAVCGGCDFQHAGRDVQLEMKRTIVLDALRRIGGRDGSELLRGPEAVGDEFGTRNRIRLSFDAAGRPGLLRRGSHEVVPVDDCLLMSPLFGKVFLPWARLLPPWRHVTLRIDSEERMVALLETGVPPSERDRRRLGKISKTMERPPEIVGLLADRIPLVGQRDLRFRVRGRALRADATSFFQVSVPGVETLVDTVESLLEDDREGALFDLYAGVGLFAACLGHGFERVVAGEADGRAIRHLKRNLRRNGVRAEVRKERTETTLRTLPRAPVETVIVDPPRAGLAPEVRHELIARAPRRILSVSCDPATAARDLKDLTGAGWRLTRLTAIDLFPATAHVETVALLVK
jgi:tRNA/tmRNA/rRNA uracil-C5-methylase (TrmA/RlmC/RlmD family)